MGNRNSKDENPRKKPTDTQQAAAKLHELNATLESRYELLEKKIAQEVQKARELIREDKKDQAALCLKRKKTYELQKARIQANIANNEEIIARFDEAIVNNEVFQAQKLGAKQLKNIHKGVKVEDIEDQIADVQEAMANAEDVSNALAQPLTEHDDLDDELRDLQESLAMEDLEEEEAQLSKVKTTKKVEKVREEEEEEEEEDEELSKLKLEMAA